MKKIIVFILSSASFGAFAMTDLTNAQGIKDYCASTGGVVVNMQAQFDTHNGYVSGVSRDFCKYKNHGNIAYVGLDTLSTAPTLAATYTEKLIVDPNNLPTSPYANPSLNVCQILHGSEISFSSNGGFSDKLGEADICVFGDGSAISAWTMIYVAEGTRPDVKSVIRSTPLNIDIPEINSSGK